MCKSRVSNIWASQPKNRTQIVYDPFANRLQIGAMATNRDDGECWRLQSDSERLANRLQTVCKRFVNAVNSLKR